MTRVIINGSKGRMGRALLACAPHHPEVQVAAQVDQGDDIRTVIDQADVVIDFSTHTATPALAALCAEHRKAMVIGTTGHSNEDRSAITRFSAAIPMVLASNFSTGVNTLFWLTRKAAEVLGPAFDLEIVEMHHRLKRDAPSGTARTLAEILAAVRQQQYDRVAARTISIVGERTAAEIGVHSIRGGDVWASTPSSSPPPRAGRTDPQSVLARNFCQWRPPCAQWVVRQPPGLYDMQDVLGLK
jgi:4-hydroxy-tetrahydrodipicolinate reductase